MGVQERPMYCNINGGENAARLTNLQSYVTCCRIRIWTEADGTTWEECAERQADDTHCQSSSPDRNALGSPCQLADLQTYQVSVVSVAMDLPAEIRYAELMADAGLVQKVKQNVGGSFAAAAGVPVEYVTVDLVQKTRRRLDARKSSLRRLTAGGVQARAQIVAPAGTTVAAVQSAIVATGQETLATSIVGAILNVSGIENAAPGYDLSQLVNRSAGMISALQETSAFSAPELTTTEMVLEASSPLAIAAQGNLVTTTTLPATATQALSTTNVPAGEATSGSRGLVAMTITTAAGAVLVAVSA